MHWHKLGRIFAPPTDLPWMHTYAALPFARRVGAHHNIYFSGRDAQGRSRIGFFVLDLSDPPVVRQVSHHTLLELGQPGTFDDNGITMSWITTHQEHHYLYYSGWTLGQTVPFYFYIGLAVSDDDGATFRRVSPAPILGRNPVDPYLTASPCVLIEQGRWRMWYVSGTGWTLTDGAPRHYYHIKYAESDDGMHWTCDGTVCIDFKDEHEYAIARPCVLRDPDKYRMWYCYRGASYRIGYAESDDGITWQRKDDQAGIDVSPDGWDSEMLAYPYVFDHNDTRYMLYNGNGYGKTGIGLAVLATDTRPAQERR
jgi:predicted GH43/DUF377 family glycosyl hydrolase